MKEGGWSNARCIARPFKGCERLAVSAFSPSGIAGNLGYSHHIKYERGKSMARKRFPFVSLFVTLTLLLTLLPGGMQTTVVADDYPLTEEFDSDVGFTSTHPDIYREDGKVHWSIRLSMGDAPTSQTTLKATADTMVTSHAPSMNWGDYVDMRVGYYHAYGDVYSILRSLVQSDLSSIPPCSEISSATLRVYYFLQTYPAADMWVTAYRVTSPWSEMEANWYNIGEAYGESYGSVLLTSELGFEGWKSMDVTDLVQAWVDGTHSNYGIMLRGDESLPENFKWLRTIQSEELDYEARLVVNHHPGTAPTTPYNPSPADDATDVSTNADLSWSGGHPCPGESVKYDVYLDNSDPPTTLICNDVPTPACDPGTLDYSTHYYWYVVATDDHGASTTGDTWDFTTLTRIYLPLVLRDWPPQPPGAPTLYEIHNPDGDGNYTVSWSASSGATSYTMEEDDNESFTSPAVAYSGSLTSTTFSDKPAGTYYYRVNASNPSGTSDWSSTESVVVCPLPDSPTLHPIDNADGDGTYTVSWTPPPDSDFCTLQEDDNAAFTSPTILYSGPGTSIIIPIRPPGTYCYRVNCTNDCGTSGWSNSQCVTVMPAPDAPILDSIENEDGDGDYVVSWSASAGASSYTLEEDDNESFTSPAVAYSGSLTSTTFSDKPAGTYYYRVNASNPSGTSDWSKVESVTVLPPEKPTRGNWTGQSNAFTVSADNGYVCSFTMYWLDSPACGVLSSYSFPCTPIDAGGHFTYDAPFIIYDITYDGDFTSATTASGTWNVQWGTCNSNGTWSASPATEGSFSCNNDGDVEICAWVNIPNPIEGESVVVYGQLLDAGIGQDGLPMHTEWHFETTTETCDNETGADGAGLARCSAPTGQAQAGYTVIIDVTITYNSHIYTTSTWFTPRERPSQAQLKPVASAKRWY
jgi:hypothetical protein